MSEPVVAVLIPCYNEELTVAQVVDDFAEELPEATIYVYDNCSSDATAVVAKEHGAEVRFVTRRGKGNVVRQMFREIEADYYVMVDGDNTYPAQHVHALLDPLKAGEADMVIGDRLSNNSYQTANTRAFHSFGNKLVRSLIQLIYGVKIVDVLTGYRAFNRLYVKTCPITSHGFELETELTMHTIDKNWRFAEVPVAYRNRAEGSKSKLSTVNDGVKILLTILSLFKDYRPLALFSLIGLIFCLVGLVLGGSVIWEFMQTGLVKRFPTAILAASCVVVGVLSFFCGLILDTIVKGVRKQYEHTVLLEYQKQEQTRYSCEQP